MRRTILAFIAASFAYLALVAWACPQSAGSVAFAATPHGAWGSRRIVHMGMMLPLLPEPPAPLIARSSEDRDPDYKLRETDTIRQTFDLGPGAHALDVDNVNGSIAVVGTDSNQVVLVVNKTIRAESQAKLEEAKREVKLEVKHEGGSLKLLMDGPFRCRCGDDERFRWNVNYRGDEGYIVKMDFELQVPRNTDFRLSTVNSGNIRVTGLRGQFSVRNVNGGIAMTDVAGAGSAHTVNGEVKVAFRENPRSDSSFKSINGDVDLVFRPGLSADFRFKTFNGEVYSDFVVTSLPARGIQEERSGRRKIWRADRFTNGRVGAGGIEIRTENLNGDIRIRESQ